MFVDNTSRNKTILFVTHDTGMLNKFCTRGILLQNGTIKIDSKVDKVISKYFEVSKKEIREQKEKQVQKQLQKRTVVKTIMESVTKMTETIEQELAAEKFVKENVNSKFIGITNKKNLVFETKSGQVKITPNGEIL